MIDANSLIHRAFHALPPLTGKGGKPTGALYGLSSILLKTLGGESRPDYVAAAFDRPEPTFRKEAFADYKAHRPKTPDELVNQIDEARDLFKRFGVNSFEKPGYEADDVIGTFVKKFKDERGLQIVILTGDLDTLQLVEDDHIVVQILKKGVSETMLYDQGAVVERYGLRPGQMTDYKGLVGDASDNIPGVRGIGPKTAEGLLKKYGTLENLFKKMPEEDPAAKKILPFEEEAFFSKKLATINQDAPVSAALSEIRFTGLDENRLVPYFEELGFESLIRRMSVGDKGKKEGAQEKLFPLSPPRETFETDKNDFKVAWDWKPILKKMIGRKEETPEKIFDLSLAFWLLNPDETDISPEAAARRFMKKEFEKADQSRLSEILSGEIKKKGLEKIYYEIEMPLILVLAWIETWGIKVDEKKLEEIRNKMTEEIGGLTKKIHAAAGETFNINSPRQVARILFEKLGIKAAKRKKTGTGLRSTSEETLSALKDEHPIVKDLLLYRETFKVRSTYAEPLLGIRGEDGRVRSNFRQIGTSTGRLSSQAPNLQNIPQESKWAKDLRDGFVPEKGFTFASFDYAQLELRLLAHLADEQKLIAAFKEGLDIHSLTASRVLRMPLPGITKAERRLGKTLNFGVVYGMGPRAFAQSAGVGLEEAKKFINDYYREFPGVRKWQNKIKDLVKIRGYVENPNGRKRWFWGDARHPKMIGEIERAVINMPLQSFGADILKLSMIKSFDLMRERDWFGEKARLLLTIHDELLFEIRDDILKEMTSPVKKIMEEICSLAAPLAIEIRTGKKWGSLEKNENV